MSLSRIRSASIGCLVLILVLAIAPVFTAGPKFYPDDPLQREPESRDASGAKSSDIGLMYEIAMNLFAVPHLKPSNTRAHNVNTVDEVPDSSWFTNRIGRMPLRAEDLARGPNVDRPPTPERWLIVAEKGRGAKPGFTAQDANGDTWFVQFDDKDRHQASTGAVEVATKIFWALGYNQVQTFITTVDPRRVEFDPKAMVRRPSGERTPFVRKDLEDLLDRAQPNPDGTYRVVAGRRLTGEVLGGFRYSGTRPDDPNDVVPHEHRRELRALRVFGAWTNLTDLKAGNTLDTLVKENGRQVVKHYLQDVGSTFGTANGVHDWDIGWEHFYQGDTTAKRLLTFGFGLSPWQTVPYTEYPSIGKIEGDRFDPREWKPQTPTLAYVEMRADDAFWAARLVAKFSNDAIRAIVAKARYSEPAAAAYISDTLIKRRDKVLKAWLTGVNPIVEPRLSAGGTLTFENAAVGAGVATAPTAYVLTWSKFDNATGTNVGQTQEARVESTRGDAPPSIVQGAEFVSVAIRSLHPDFPGWNAPVNVYFRKAADGWQPVGLDRQLPRVTE